MRASFLSTCLFLFLVFKFTQSIHNIDQFKTLLDDSISYRINFKYKKDLQGNREIEHNFIQIFSSDDEEYQCVLPKILESSKRRISSYDGPSPADLLQPIYNGNVCSYRIETYWFYELCHGRYVLQYHDDKETNTRTEFYLGNFGKIQADSEAKEFDQLNPPTKKIGEEYKAYYPVKYNHGTICDLTHKPRTTTVLYVCDETAKTQIHSINEVSSCTYEIIVLTNHLCAHPAFQKSTTKEHDINCFALNEKQHFSKPKALSALENESSSQFFREYALFKSPIGSNRDRDVFKILKFDEEDGGLDQLTSIIDALKSAMKSKTSSLHKKTKSSPEIPGFNVGDEKELSGEALQSSIKSFLNGETCLIEVIDKFWKFEICYGRKVTMFHEENGKRHINVMLGVFNLELHKAWLTQLKGDAVLRGPDGSIVQVTNMYTKGDICPEALAHRSCKVHMKCLEDSGDKIYLKLVEQESCTYTLNIESKYLCEPLQEMGEYGLPNEGIPSMNEIDASYEPKLVSVSKQKLKKQSKNDHNIKVNSGDSGSSDERNAETEKAERRSSHSSLFDVDVMDHNQVLQFIQEIIPNDDNIIVKKVVIARSEDDEPEKKGKGVNSDENSDEELDRKK